MADSDVLTFPPVDIAPDEELVHAVREVPLVRDARRLAEWVEGRCAASPGASAR